MMTEQLRKGVLNFRQTLFQGIAASAPAGAAVATMTGSAAYALGALPLAALVAFAIVALNGYIIKRISSHVAGAGGYYDYIKMGFGRFRDIFWMDVYS
ncbi:amino acid transporter, partial [mine drainage metagenome]